MKKKTVCISICILLIIAVLPTSGTIVEKSSILSFGGKTIYVGGNGPGNYSKIQEAINDSSDDDTVYVYNGTYNENVIVNKSIDLIGEDKNTTKIKGCVYISADYVIFSNFTLQYEYYYSGISLSSNYSVIMCRNIHLFF